MPRRQFVADLQQTKNGILPPGILDLRAGEDDGQIVFSYTQSLAGKSPPSPVSITAMVSDVGDYPKSHEYMIFCADDAPRQLADKLQSLPSTNGRTVLKLLDLVSESLSQTASETTSNGSVPSLNDDYDYEDEEDENEADEYMEDDDDAFFNCAPSLTKQSRSKLGQLPRALDTPNFYSTSRDFRNRTRSDLRAVKDAGFRISLYGNILDAANCYVIISIRTSKLGLSEEAMQAWQIHPEEYLMLVIHYPSGYKTGEQIQEAKRQRHHVTFGMRVFCSATHKPVLTDIIRAFQVSSLEKEANRGINTQQEATCSIRNTFISKPLIGLLENHLVDVLRFRSAGLDWNGAEKYFHDVQEARIGEKVKAAEAQDYESEPRNHALPAIVNSDHYTQAGVPRHSFPLLAMQFMLRHFVRCVEFCLVCHRKTDSKIEAIKPYVCSRPLCLFQYMAMGFGPSIEHEIQSQPWVVDLLVSFCYSSAAARRLKDLPVGLGITVPGLPGDSRTKSHSQQNQYLRASYDDPESEKPKRAMISKEFNIGFDRERRELTFSDKEVGGCPVSRGQWIVIKAATKVNGRNGDLHCRVKETNFYPVITIDEPVTVANTSTNPQNSTHPWSMPLDETKSASPTKAYNYTQTTFVRYDCEFDYLGHNEKCDAICQLLNILPSVKDMSQWLDRTSHNDLKRWPERIPLATLNLLRWIIASNRACIMQVDGYSAAKDNAGNEIRKAFKQERLHGMSGYVQFRFAMGAPDKEERFLSEVRRTTDRLKLKHPTIFAWHGSPLYNWHMIIREGLHFKRTDHGRAYGDGVYHARDAQTSLGYTGFRAEIHGDWTAWMNSCLNVSSALALNELVNAPAEFQSQNPFYVVKQLDWIQTRYLLVRCSTDTPFPEESVPEKAHQQDPECTPTGVSGRIIIPASAIVSGLAQDPGRQGANKKLKGSSGDPICIDTNSDYESDESAAEDRQVLQEEVEFVSQQSYQSLLLVGRKPCKTIEDFALGKLDYATLPLMPVPTYATSTTTKRLMNELGSMQKALNATEPSELGWYIDLEKTDNVYQWIVELHSFHTMEVKGKRIPLADDMKSLGITSVVLEVRFGSDFPFSPPYVRVVRPRFRTFAEGGGGHIVMGGAMCMELLTNTGWSGINSMESVLLQVRLAIASEPFARLRTVQAGDYGIAEAADGFIRACRAHGWVEPPGFREIAYGIGSPKRSWDPFK